MASTTTNNNLAVHNDAAVYAGVKLNAPAMALQGIEHEQTGAGGTYAHRFASQMVELLYVRIAKVLSAPAAKGRVGDNHGGTA